jgi:hypothetical protein
VAEDQYRRLASAVMLQAVLDAIGVRGPHAATEHEAHYARKFITSRSGPWAKARALWADAADVRHCVHPDSAERLMALEPRHLTEVVNGARVQAGYRRVHAPVSAEDPPP